MAPAGKGKTHGPKDQDGPSILRELPEIDKTKRPSIAVSKGLDANANGTKPTKAEKSPKKRDKAPLDIVAMATDGKVAGIRKLWKSGQEVLSPGCETWEETLQTAILKAASGGYADVVNALLKMNATVEWEGYKELSPLMSAASKGNMPMMELLLKKEANANTCVSQCTALQLACRGGHRDAVKLLLKVEASISPPGMPPLKCAAEAGHDHLVDLLVAAGASVNAAEANGETALLLACREGQEAVVKQLVQAGATAKSAPGAPNALFTALEKSGNPRIIKTVLNAGATMIGCGTNALAIACSSAFSGIEICQFMLSLNPKLLNMPDKDGRSPCMLAIMNGNIDKLRYLILKGAELNTSDRNGWSALHHAAKQGDPRIISLVASIVDNLKPLNNEGQAPMDVATIHLAKSYLSSTYYEAIRVVRHGAHAVLQALSLYGASPEATDEMGDSVIMEAVLLDRADVVKLILSPAIQANPSTPNRFGFPALMWAYYLRRGKIVQMLENAGATLSSADKEGLEYLDNALELLPEEAAASYSNLVLLDVNGSGEFSKQEAGRRRDRREYIRTHRKILRYSALRERMVAHAQVNEQEDTIWKPQGTSTYHLDPLETYIRTLPDGMIETFIVDGLLADARFHTCNLIATGIPQDWCTIFASCLFTSEPILFHGCPIFMEQLTSSPAWHGIQRHFFSAVCDLKPAPPCLVYRVMESCSLDSYESGRMCSWANFFVGTTNCKQIGDFLFGPKFDQHCQGVVFVAQGYTARSLAPFSPRPLEEEHVFLPNTKFRVALVADFHACFRNLESPSQWTAISLQEASKLDVVLIHLVEILDDPSALDIGVDEMIMFRLDSKSWL